MTWDDILAEIIRDEGGIVQEIYLDPLVTSPDFPNGAPTVGPGLLLKPGYRVPMNALTYWTDHKFREKIKDYYRFEKVYGVNLDLVRRAVITGMIWNMGLRGVSRFRRMIAALQAEDYESAADEILDSRVHRQLSRIRDDAVFRGQAFWPVRTERWYEKMLIGED